MKKIKTLVATALASTMLLTACGQSASTPTESVAPSLAPEVQALDEKLNILVTTFPIYDWMREIIGENSETIELSLLIDTGVDLHSYQPTTADIAEISTADMFVFNGGDSDTWVKDVIDQKINENMVCINLMDEISGQLVAEEIVHGMEAHDHDDHAHEDEAHDHDDHAHEDEAHDHDDHAHEDEAHDHDDHAHEDEAHDHALEEDVHVHDGEIVYDEHVWLSIENAVLMTEILSSELQALDAENAETYIENTESYIEELNSLDVKYTETLAETAENTLLFADRFPFRYLVDDYNLSYYAAFPGCSAETEASFETVVYLAEKVDEHQMKNIMIIDGSSADIANTIISSSTAKDAEILILDSLQSVTAEDIENGATYISLMEQNLEVLELALNS